MLTKKKKTKSKIKTKINIQNKNTTKDVKQSKSTTFKSILPQ